MPLDMTINLDRLRSVRLKLRRGLVKLAMCSALGLDERKKKTMCRMTRRATSVWTVDWFGERLNPHGRRGVMGY